MLGALHPACNIRPAQSGRALHQAQPLSRRQSARLPVVVQAEISSRLHFAPVNKLQGKARALDKAMMPRVASHERQTAFEMAQAAISGSKAPMGRSGALQRAANLRR